MTFRKLDHTAFKQVFALHRDHDPSFESATLDHFITYLFKVEGIVIEDRNTLAAAVYFDNYRPDTDIIIHCVSDPAYRARWVNRAILRHCFGFPFNTLNLPRLTGYSIDGVTDDAGGFVLAMGFKLEGRVRRGIKIRGEYRDILLYGMLREECRWLR